MAYERTVWKNREVERPRTFEKIENPDGTITLVPAEGNIIESGTPIVAENMNNIEQGIVDAHDELAAHKADYIHLPYSIADGTNNYTTLINGIASLVEGMSVKIKFTNANTGASTLNINGLGAIPIKKSNGNDLSAGNIKAGQICHLVYTGSVFQLLGEGGEYGTAQPEHVLEGYTIGTEEGIKSGTMPNRGKINNTITTQGGQIVVPEGYHDGSGIVKAQFANLVPENIKDGVNVGGVVGTHKGMIKYGMFEDSNWRPEKENTIDVGFAPDWVIAYNDNYSHNTKARYRGNIPGWSNSSDVATSLRLSYSVYVTDIILTSNGFIAKASNAYDNKGYGSFVWLAVKA